AKKGAQDKPGEPMSPTFLAALKKGTGQAKLASCDVSQVSHEDALLGGVGHGVFTYYLLDALRGGAGPDQDGLVRLDAVASYVTRNVSEWVKEYNRDPQSPAYY